MRVLAGPRLGRQQRLRPPLPRPHRGRRAPTGGITISIDITGENSTSTKPAKALRHAGLSRACRGGFPVRHSVLREGGGSFLPVGQPPSFFSPAVVAPTIALHDCPQHVVSALLPVGKNQCPGPGIRGSREQHFAAVLSVSGPGGGFLRPLLLERRVPILPGEL